MTALYHAYTQTVADGTATSVVRPSDWNSAHVQGQTLSGNTAGVSSFTGTNFVLQGGNNVTLSAATAAGAATIVISGANTVAQTVQTQASGAIAGTGFTSTTTAGTAITAAMGNNGLSMAIPAFLTTYAAQTADTNKAGTGFTSTTTAGTAITAALGTNGLSMAVPAFITTYVAQTTQTQAAGNIAGAGYTSTTQAGSTVGITQNSNGLSAAWPAFITTATQSADTNKAGTGFTSTTTAGTAITAALGTNGLNMAVPAYITTYVAQTTQTQAAGNIAGAGYTSTTQAGSTVGITQNSNGLSAAWPAFITTATQSTQTQASGAIAGTGFTSTTTAGTAITAALGTNGLNMAVPAFITTYVAQTTQTQAAGNIAGAGYTSTTQAGSTVGITQNSNGLSAAWPAFITTAAQSADTNKAGTGFTSTTTAGTAITAALGTNGLSMAVPAFVTTFDATSGRAGTGFTSTTTAGTAITAALGTNGLSMAVPAYITTFAAQTQQPMYFSASGTSTSANTIQFGNSNGVSFSLSNGSVVGTVATNYAGLNETTAATNALISLSLETNGVALSVNVPNDDFNGWNLVGVNTSGTTGTTITTQTPFYLSGGNNITLSGNSNTIVISAGAGGGTTNQTGPNIAVAGSTITSGTVVFSNSNGVSFGMAGSTITATVADPIISYYDLYELGNNSVLTSFGQNSLHFQIFVPGMNLTMTGINMLASMSSTTSAASAVAGLTMSYGVYSKGSGASTSQLLSMATSSFFINAFASSTTTASYAVGQVGSSFTTTSGGTVINSVLSGAKALQLPFATSLASSGEYAFVFAQSTSSVGNTNPLRLSHVVMTAASGASASYGLINTGGVSASNTSVTQEFQQLIWSTTSNAWPATIAYSNLSNNGASVNHAFAYFNA